jgi:two-component system chemotaxis response regulator CheB
MRERDSLDVPFDVVALAASAGGLRALTAVLAPLPRDFPAAILVAQHMAPQFRNPLVKLLDGRTALSVAWAAPGEPAFPGTVRIAPPDQHLLVGADGALVLSRGPRVRCTRPAADPLFASVARAYGKRTLAVVLTGMGCDGAAGVHAVKTGGGRVLAQDPATAQEDGMPCAAIATGCVDSVLPLELIGPALRALLMAPEWLRPCQSMTGWPSRLGSISYVPWSRTG